MRLVLQWYSFVCLFVLDMTSKAQVMKAKLNKWDYIKPKRLCTVKETRKLKPSNEEKYVQVRYLIKG